MSEVDLVERMARASYEAEVNRWPQYARGFQKWEELGPETKNRFRFAARAAKAIVLEEAAKVAEAAGRQPVGAGDGNTYIIGTALDAAAAIRKLGEE